LPKSSAIVFSIRTEVRKLTDLNVVERRELVDEIKEWDSDVSIRKGVELWLRAVVGWCEEKKLCRGDESVINSGVMVSVGNQ
jgi:hypothetical protein